MSPTDLRQEADSMRAELKRLKRVLAAIDKQLPRVTKGPLRAEIEAMRRESQASYEEVEANLGALDAILEAERLPVRKQPRSVNTMNAQAHALATSGGKSKDALIQVANRHGYTLRRLAKESGVSAALLSRARRGDRTLKRAIADKIEALIGFKATSPNWPGGLT